MTSSTRRSFLSSMAAAGAALPFARAAAAHSTFAAPRAQKILILGGTAFLGPQFVRAALAKGHTVTLFNRGKTNPKLFPDLEKLVGDRETGDLKALEGRSFDAVVDTSGYVPAHVAATAKLFADKCRHYTFISSISVFGSLGERAETLDESSPVSTVSDDDAAKVNTIRQSMPFYGPLKARCEAAAEAAMPGRVANIRPGLIVGPGDVSDRFTWWPVRIDKGGDVLCPGDRDGRVQFLDVRDLAEWMVHCIEHNVVGVHIADGFAGPVTMEQVLIGCQCATATPGNLVWASEEFLSDNKVGAWMEMPLWIPREGRSLVRNDKAIAAGLRFRPVADTIRDTLQWAKTERGEKPFERTGVKAEKESALLAKWKEQQTARK
jgi:2'-hydroxyisoflavone reductase